MKKTNLLVAHRQQLKVVVVDDLKVAQVALLHHLGYQRHKERGRARRLEQPNRGLCARSRVHLRAEVISNLAGRVQALENGGKLGLNCGVCIEQRADRELLSGDEEADSSTKNEIEA